MTFSPQFTEQEYRLFCDFVHERYGLVLACTKAELIALKLSARLAAVGVDNFTHYLHCLKYGDQADRESKHMVGLITNNETYFFREEKQLGVFAQVLVKLQEEKQAVGNRSVRIISAGCSTGEEAYTLAMLGFENGGFFFDWDFKVIGMDVDRSAIERAEVGHYFPRSFRMTDQRWLDRYFAPNCNGVVVKSSIRRFTQFMNGNLLIPADWDRLGRCDVIFCRNVLIYFSPEKILQALSQFHRALLPGGRLFLGHSETIHDDRFSPEHHSHAIIYRRRD